MTGVRVGGIVWGEGGVWHAPGEVIGVKPSRPFVGCGRLTGEDGLGLLCRGGHWTFGQRPALVLYGHPG